MEIPFLFRLSVGDNSIKAGLWGYKKIINNVLTVDSNNEFKLNLSLEDVILRIKKELKQDLTNLGLDALADQVSYLHLHTHENWLETLTNAALQYLTEQTLSEIYLCDHQEMNHQCNDDCNH